MQCIQACLQWMTDVIYDWFAILCTYISKEYYLNNYTVWQSCWLPLWSSGQNSWLQIQTSGLDSQRYQIFWEVVGLECGPLSLVSTIEALLERKSSGSSLGIWEYSRRDPSRWPYGTLYPSKGGTNFADKWRSLSWYSSLVNSGHRV
jgi:hypothetical protein